MFRFTAIFLLPLCTCYVFSSTYKIPAPVFDVREHVLQVTLPDEDGIELFYFYGRLVKKNGDIIKILMDTREKTNGQWILIDFATHSFEVGDYITYWLYIKKDGVGYRMPYAIYNIEYVIGQYTSTTEFDSYTPHLVEPSGDIDKFSIGDPVNLDGVPSAKTVECKSSCEHELKNMTDMVTSMELHIESLEEMVMRIWEKLNQKRTVQQVEIFTNNTTPE